MAKSTVGRYDEQLLAELAAGKSLRDAALGIYFARAQVRFRNTAGTRLLIEQLREFPQADHDDGPDALELAVRRLEMLTMGR